MEPPEEKKHLKYNTVEEWMEAENVPHGFFKIEDSQLRNKYIDEYGELRQHLFKQHVKSLSKKEQELFAKGNHPSQSHKFEARAKVYAKGLEKELSNLDFVENVSVGFYHMDRIVLSVDINRNISKEECKKIPWLYNGFETKIGFAQLKSDEIKKLEQHLSKSKKIIHGHIVFLTICIIVAILIWLVWNPEWWIYLLILFVGLFGLIGDLINIGYCKNRIKVNANLHEINRYDK